MAVLDRLTVDLFRRGADGRLRFKPYRFGSGYVVPSERAHYELHRELRRWYSFYLPFAIFIGLFALMILPSQALLAFSMAAVVVMLYVVRMHYVGEELRRANHKVSGRGLATASPIRIRTAADERWRWS